MTTQPEDNQRRELRELFTKHAHFGHGGIGESKCTSFDVQELDALLTEVDTYLVEREEALLEYLHRNEGEGIPERDYDNATDEIIDVLLERLSAPQDKEIKDV